MRKLLLALAMLLLLPASGWCENLPELSSAGLADLIAQNKGKVIMLNFFATWCPPCRAEVPEIVKLRDAYPEAKLFIAGLSVDESAAPVQPFIKKNNINYPVYMAQREVSMSYGVTSVPHNAFIDPEGRLIISEPGMADEKVLQQVVGDLLK